MYPITLTQFDAAAFRDGVARSNLAYARGPARISLSGETIGQRLRATVERVGERPALVIAHQGFRATYGELWSEVDQAARALIARGLTRNERIALWAPSRREWVVTQLAAARAGAVVVPVDPAAGARGLTRILAATGASMLVMARGATSTDEAQRVLAGVRADCPDVRATVVLEDEWDAFLAAGDAIDDWELAEREAGARADDPAVVLHPLGASAPLRGATLSHRAVLGHAEAVAASLRASEQDRACVPVPLHHCFGLVAGLLGTFTSGACVVLPSESFDPAAVLTAIEQERCSVLLGVSSMFIAVLEHAGFAGFDLTSLRAGSMGGAPFSAELIRSARTRMHLDEVAIVVEPPAPRARPRRRESRMGMIQNHARRGLAVPGLGL